MTPQNAQSRLIAEKPDLPQEHGTAAAEHHKLRIAWVTRSFLDYRIPVYAALDKIVCGSLYLLYSADYVPERPQRKLQQVLGNRAIGLRGEWRIGPEDRHFMANRNLSLRFQPGLWKTIRQVKPEVLVVDGFFKWSFVAFLYRIMAGTPLVILYERTFHTERQAQWFRTIYRKIVLQFTDAMSCNGRLCQEYAEWLGMPANRITLGHMAADVEIMQRGAQQVKPELIAALRAKWGSSPKSLVFLYVGRLIGMKGLREFLAGWALFNKSEDRNHQSETTLVIVGSGPEDQNLHHQASALGVNNLHFAGSVDYDSLAPFYAASDVFVIPTLEDNWSLVVPEAMACGLPILCSKYNGCWPELVYQNKNGWLFDPLDPQDTLKCLRLCKATSAADLRKMGENSRTILEDYTPSSAAKAIYASCEYAISHFKQRSR
jgi:glycosyltransferase involved in cell wall biosynthesis